MKLNNRFIFGILSLLLAAVIAFVALPTIARQTNGKEEIVRITQPVLKGEQISSENAEVVEVGGYNLPSNIAHQLSDVNGLYATADLAVGDYILTSKISSVPVSSDVALNSIPSGKVAISLTVKTLASGLSDKLQPGDIIRIYHFLDTAAEVPELRFVKVLSVTDSDGINVDNAKEPTEDEEKQQSATITVLASPEQAKIITGLENDGVAHVALISRNNDKLADELLAEQDKTLQEIYFPETLIEEEAADAENSDVESEPQETETAESAQSTNETAPSAEKSNQGRRIFVMGKVITVWGSPGSGKSMFCCILAKALTRDKRKAIIINADMNVPMLPVWLPEQIIQTNTSIGQVLSSVEIDTSLVASHVTVLKNYPFIGMMGYAAGENPLSYPEVKYTMVLQLIHAAAKLVDFVILDCSTSMTNVFTPAAIEAGDVVIRILTPDLKGINYLKAHQPLLVDERFRFSEHMTFAGLARPFHALDEMGYIIGGFDGLLPYSKEIDRCATEGGMFKAITYCNPKYTASLNKVLEILEQMELAEQSEDDAAYECEEDADE